MNPTAHGKAVCIQERFILFTIAMTGVSAELLLTRVLSLKYLSHAVYSIVAVAILGYGIGQTIISMDRKFDEGRRRSQVSGIMSLTALSLAAALFTILYLPTTNRIGDILPWGNYLSLVLSYILTAIPFIGIGAGLALLFRDRSDLAPTLYTIDLAGAVTGVVGYFILIDHLGALSATMLLSALLAFTGWLLGERPTHALLTTTILAVATAGLLLTPEANLDFSISHHKESDLFKRTDSRVSVERLEWYSQGRVELLKFPGGDFIERLEMPGTFDVSTDRKPEALYFATDGMAGTPVYNFADTSILPRPFTIPMEAPYLFLNEPSLMVLGAGGGRDLFMGRMHGARKMIGAEINAVTFRLMSHDLVHWTGNIYHDDRTEVRCVDGRFLARQIARSDPGSLDLIILNGVDSYNALSSGAYAYAESYLYTTEAIRDYLACLSDSGILNFNRWFYESLPRETLRLFVMASDELSALGIDPRSSIIVLEYRGWGILLVRKTPFTDNDLAGIRAYVSRLNSTRREVDETHIIYLAGRTDGFDASSVRTAPFHQFMSSFRDGHRDHFLAGYPVEVGSVTDDRPYFYKSYRTLDVLRRLNRLGETTYAGEEWPTVMQLIAFITCAMAIGIFFFLPLSGHARGFSGWHLSGWGLYFASLGMGFILLEMSLMQRFILILGHPMYSLVTCLAGILFGLGAGSSFWNGSSLHWKRWTFLCVLLMAILLAILHGFHDAISESVLAWPLVLRALFVAFVAAAVGFLAGGFYPLGLSRFGAHHPDLIPWAMAVNTGFTVSGSLVTILLSQAWGFRACLLAALVLYGIAFTSLRKLATHASP